MGLCVVVLALIGSAMAGFLLNVDKVEKTTTGYNYVTDITGLFDISDDPQYIEYNPASNYTGYTADVVNLDVPTGISFQPSSVANNYRIITELGQTITGPSGTINDSSTYPQISQPSKTFSVASSAIRPSATGTHAPLSSSLVTTKATTLYDWATATFGDLSQYDSIVVDWTSPSVAYPVSYAFFHNATSTLMQVSTTHWASTTINPKDLTFITQTTSTGITAKGSLYDYYIYYGDATQTTLMWNLNNSYNVTATPSLSISYTSTITYAPTYEYMIPSAGVTLAPNPLGGYFTTEWDNDTGTAYDNVKVDVLIQLTDSGRIQIFGVGAYFNVSKAEYGNFPAVMVTFDTLRGIAEVRPVVRFVNFFDYDVADTVIDSMQTNGVLQYVDTIGFEALATSGGWYTPLRWSIVNTTIEMDTHNAVMVDPSINLANYWPDMEAYRFWVQSVALYGDSVTINGQTYEIGPNESITVNGITERFRNVYISYDLDNNVTLTFVSSNRSYDLGQAVDRTLSFGGIWYFNMGLYEGTGTTMTDYEWAGSFDNADTIIIFGLGVLLVLWIAFSKAGYRFKLLDKVVIGVAVFALVGFIGGFI